MQPSFAGAVGDRHPAARRTRRIRCAALAPEGEPSRSRPAPLAGLHRPGSRQIRRPNLSDFSSRRKRHRKTFSCRHDGGSSHTQHTTAPFAKTCRISDSLRIQFDHAHHGRNIRGVHCMESSTRRNATRRHTRPPRDSTPSRLLLRNTLLREKPREPRLFLHSRAHGGISRHVRACVVPIRARPSPSGWRRSTRSTRGHPRSTCRQSAR